MQSCATDVEVLCRVGDVPEMGVQGTDNSLAFRDAGHLPQGLAHRLVFNSGDVMLGYAWFFGLGRSKGGPCHAYSIV